MRYNKAKLEARKAKLEKRKNELMQRAQESQDVDVRNA